MSSEEPSFLAQIIKISRPAYILSGILFYALGVGIADYLGLSISWNIYFIGQAWISLLQLSSYYLDAYFTRISSPTHSSISGTRNDLSVRLLQMAVSTLATVAVLTVILYFQGTINSTALLFLGISFFLAFFQSVPPLCFTKRGYGDMVEAIFQASLIPTIAFLLQSQELHRMLALLTFPLVILFIAMRIAQAFPLYASDTKTFRNSILTRLSWENGMTIHNIMILAAYFLLIASTFLGLPWTLVWPSLSVIPLGLYQIWQMTRISSGTKPNWKILIYTSTANLGLCAYLLALTLWIG